MKVAFITTLQHNVGDDFVREGILHLLSEIIEISEPLFIHKHLPLTVRPEWDWIHGKGISRALDSKLPNGSLRLTRALDRIIPLKANTDKILSCDLLVQSGAPVYWLHGNHGCGDNEWYGPLIRRRWRGVRERVPLLSLAGGSCQGYGSNGSEFMSSPKTLGYIREFFDACRLTTLRDDLAGKILELAGRKASILPCTSIFARQRLRIECSPPDYVALNFMPIGGHYHLGGSTELWERKFSEFVERLPRKNEVCFVCHDRRELAVARKLFPSFKHFWSESHADYLRFYSRAKFGILNRVHGGFALASFGRPSLIIGNDSRAEMAEMIGLSHCHASQATSESLLDAWRQLDEDWQDYGSRFERIQTQARKDYLVLLRNALAIRRNDDEACQLKG